MSEHIEKSFGPNSNMALDSECNDEFYDEAIKRQYAYYKEQLALYIWYKQDYPNRIDPYDIIGDIEFDDIFDASIKKYPNSLITFEEATEIEEEYEAEEDKMLVRLLKIRRSLWT
jgi:hypothetical protein